MVTSDATFADPRRGSSSFEPGLGGESMAWIYILVATAGLVPLVPALLRATERVVTPGPSTFAGFALTGFGLTGALATQLPTSTTEALIAALAVGLAAGAVHPEILGALNGPQRDEHPHEDRLASDP